MAEKITIKFIEGGTCPICGAHFGRKWGRRANLHVKFMNIKVRQGKGGGISKMRTRICKSHRPVSKEIRQWVFDCHVKYFKKQGQPGVEEWEFVK